MRKPLLDRLGRWCLPASLMGGVLALAVAFWLALAAVALVPSDLVAEHVSQAREVLAAEGEHPVSAVTGRPYDNFTVGAMLDQVESLGSGQPPLVAALAPGYARYWHGYAVVMRPLLAIGDLSAMRLACQVAFAILTIAAASLLCVRLRSKGALVAAVLVASEALVGAFDAVSCLPIFPSFAISMAGVIWVMAPASADDRDPRSMRAGFFVIGALAVYFDFLDNPILTLGIPLVAAVARWRFEGRSLRDSALLAASCCALWLCGYGLLWAAKWMLATIVLGSDVIGDALGTAQFRAGVGDEAAALDTSPLAAVALNVSALGKAAYLLALLFVALCVAALACALGKGERRALAGWLALFAAIAVVPYLWYVVLSNHSALHFDIIAFRNQALSFFALGTALVVAVDALRADRPAQRARRPLCG